MDKKEWKFIPFLQNPKMVADCSTRYEGRPVSCDRCNRQNLPCCVACEETRGVDLCSTCFSTLFESCGWCARSGIDVYGRKIGEKGVFTEPPKEEEGVKEEEKVVKEKNKGAAGKMSRKEQEKYAKERRDANIK